MKVVRPTDCLSVSRAWHGDPARSNTISLAGLVQGPRWRWQASKMRELVASGGVRHAKETISASRRSSRLSSQVPDASPSPNGESACRLSSEFSIGDTTVSAAHHLGITAECKATRIGPVFPGPKWIDLRVTERACLREGEHCPLRTRSSHRAPPFLRPSRCLLPLVWSCFVSPCLSEVASSTSLLDKGSKRTAAKHFLDLLMIG